MTATLPQQLCTHLYQLPHTKTSLLNLHSPLSYLLISSFFFLIPRTTSNLLQMALHAPTTLHTTKLAPAAGTNAGLRRPPDSVALKSSFFSPVHLLLPPKHSSAAPATAPKFSMRVASKQAYICRDCGYIYNDRTPFEKVSDSYFCPVCGAPKRRFRAYEPTVTKNANDTAVRKARKDQIKRDEAIGRALPIAIGVGAAALAGLYFYLNNSF